MNHQQIPNQVPRTSTMAIISLVTGLMCIPLVSIILGHLARSEIRKSKGSIVGQGIALTGLILGYLQLLIGILLLVGWLVATVFLYTKLNEAPSEMESGFSSIENAEPQDTESSVITPSLSRHSLRIAVIAPVERLIVMHGDGPFPGTNHRILEFKDLASGWETTLTCTDSLKCYCSSIENLRIFVDDGPEKQIGGEGSGNFTWKPQAPNGTKGGEPLGP